MINFITRYLPRGQQTQSHLTDEEVRTREASILHSTYIEGTDHVPGTWCWAYKSKQNIVPVLMALIARLVSESIQEAGNLDTA